MRRPVPVRRAASIFAAIGALFVLDLLFAATGYAFALRTSSRELSAAVKAVSRSDAVGAVHHLERAVAAAELAGTRLTRPSVQIVEAVGGRDELAALDALFAGAADTARGALGVLAPMFDAGAAERGLFGALYRDGAVNLDALEPLASRLADMEGRLADTAAVLAATDPEIGPLDRAIERATRRLERTRRQVGQARSVAELLPALLGADDPKRYFLALQSPSEARGGGGLIGVYGILAANDGRLDLTEVGAIEDLVAQLDGPVRGPEWFADLYGRFLGLEDIRHSNLTPSFPASSEILLSMYRRITGESLDGVIALDPLAVGEMTRGTGPLSAPGWDRTIDRFNARRVLLHDIYRHFDLKERIQNEYLRGLIDRLWARLESSDVRVGPLARGLGRAAAEQHVKIHATDPQTAEELAALGIDGDYRAAGDNVQLVFNNNLAANKVDFFLKRRIATRIVMRADGSARVRTTVALANEAPEASTVLVRPLRKDLPFGTNRLVLSFLLPRSAEPVALGLDASTSNFFAGREYDRPVAWQVLDVAPGETRRVRLDYRWEEAWSHASGGPELELTLWPQASVRPDFASLEVVPPPGYRVAAGVPAQEWRLRTPRDIRIELAPLPGPRA